MKVAHAASSTATVVTKATLAMRAWNGAWLDAWWVLWLVSICPEYNP